MNCVSPIMLGGFFGMPRVLFFALLVLIAVVVLRWLFKPGLPDTTASARQKHLCKHCGIAHPGFARFCRRCGRDLHA